MHVRASKLFGRFTYANVMSTFAVFLVLGGGTAYAANTVFSTDIVDGEVKNADLANNAVTSTKIYNNSVTAADIRDDNVTSTEVLLDSLTSADLAANSVTGSELAVDSVNSAKVLLDSLTAADLAISSVGSFEIATDAVQATEIANNSIDSGEVVDFGLTNQDVGVLFAQVNANGTVANSSGGVTAVHVGAGTYEVDFARDISSCAFTATQGESGVGGASGAILGVTDRGSNVEAVYVTVRTNANVLADRAFQLVVVC